MILVDTSAWIELLRDTGSSTALRLAELVVGEEVAICRPISMELLAGARSPQHLAQLQRLTSTPSLIETMPSDYDDAAALYRACRQQGETIRKMLDCLIAAHAIRVGIPILDADSDFDALARHTLLQVDRAAR